jgi:hypothetical protein
MPFELTRGQLEEDYDWLYVQDYKGGENQVTEALFKWFFFSRSGVQRRFLSKICYVHGKQAVWKRFNL